MVEETYRRCINLSRGAVGAFSQDYAKTAWAGRADDFYAKLVDRAKFDKVGRLAQIIPMYGTKWDPQLEFLERCMLYSKAWTADKEDMPAAALAQA